MIKRGVVAGFSPLFSSIYEGMELQNWGHI